MAMFQKASFHKWDVKGNPASEVNTEHNTAEFQGTEEVSEIFEENRDTLKSKRRKHMQNFFEWSHFLGSCKNTGFLCLGILLLTGSIILTSMLFTKYSTMREEIQHLRMTHGTWTNNSSNAMQNLKSEQTNLNAEVSEILSQMKTLEMQLKSQESVILKNLQSQIETLDSTAISQVKTLESKFQTQDSEKDFRLQTIEAKISKVCLSVFCPCGWKYYNGKCYYFSTENKDWDQANDACRQKGASLAMAKSEDTLIFLSHQITSKYWMGLHDQGLEGTWKWVDATSVNMTAGLWNPGEPNNHSNEDCGEIKDKKLNDSICGNRQRWICEKDF
ncbi:C-type lectin domain family 10 member A isoform X2 [Amia ocellicauda]|uniref:C-type lectin domain family 10 member A isoform X2 n=1 Tax=Amia ocellicauda TaxID=2972642 RepID=UPI0034649E30